jgi:hypothetical protein
VLWGHEQWGFSNSYAETQEHLLARSRHMPTALTFNSHESTLECTLPSYAYHPRE